MPLGARLADDCRARPRGQSGNQCPVHGLYAALWIEELVLALVGFIEGGNRLGGVARVDRVRGEVDMDLEALTGVAHLRVARPSWLAVSRDPFDIAKCLCLQGLVERGDLNTRGTGLYAHDPRGRDVDARLRLEQADGRAHSGAVWHDHRGNTDCMGHAGRM